MAKRSASRAEKPQIRLKKVRNPNPPPPPVEHQFKPGQSGNPGGRPKLLSDAYRAQLAKVMPSDPEGRTYAEIIAQGRIVAAIGDTGAAREVRQATEGERIRTWRDDIIDLLRKGKITPDDVITELGADEAQSLIAAAGVHRNEGGSPEGEGGEAPTSGATE